MDEMRDLYEESIRPNAYRISLVQILAASAKDVRSEIRFSSHPEDGCVCEWRMEDAVMSIGIGETPSKAARDMLDEAGNCGIFQDAEPITDAEIDNAQNYFVGSARYDSMR